MSKKCELTGKSPLKGHKVSHANNKVKRKFFPNLRQSSSDMCESKFLLKKNSSEYNICNNFFFKRRRKNIYLS